MDGIILVRGTVADRTGWWILDNGFDYSLIDSAAAQAAGLSLSAPDTVSQPGGEVAMRWTGAVDLGLAGGPAFRLDSAAVIDFSGLAPMVGVDLAGLLGDDFFQRHVLQIDYPRREVRLMPAAWSPGSTGATAVPLWLEAGEPFALGYLYHGGRTVPAKLKLDTGSFSGLGLNGSFVHQTRLIGEDAPRLPISGVAAGGGVPHYAARIDSMRLGGTTVREPVVSWSASDERIGDAGTLGAAILSRFVVTFDYPNHLMWLEPTADASRPEEWDAAGMLVARVPDGPVVVAQVIPNAPADRAGIRTGDVITSIDGVSVDSLSLEAIRRAFRHPETTTAVVLVREGAADPVEVALVQARLP